MRFLSRATRESDMPEIFPQMAIRPMTPVRDPCFPTRSQHAVGTVRSGSSNGRHSQYDLRSCQTSRFLGSLGSVRTIGTCSFHHSMDQSIRRFPRPLGVTFRSRRRLIAHHLMPLIRPCGRRREWSAAADWGGWPRRQQANQREPLGRATPSGLRRTV